MKFQRSFPITLQSVGRYLTPGHYPEAAGAGIPDKQPLPAMEGMRPRTLEHAKNASYQFHECRGRA